MALDMGLYRINASISFFGKNDRIGQATKQLAAIATRYLYGAAAFVVIRRPKMDCRRKNMPSGARKLSRPITSRGIRTHTIDDGECNRVVYIKLDGIQMSSMEIRRNPKVTRRQKNYPGSWKCFYIDRSAVFTNAIPYLNLAFYRRSDLPPRYRTPS